MIKTGNGVNADCADNGDDGNGDGNNNGDGDGDGNTDDDGDVEKIHAFSHPKPTDHKQWAGTNKRIIIFVTTNYPPRRIWVNTRS